MKLTDGEKLILTMLCDLYKKLDVRGEVDPKFVQEAISSGNLWGLKWQYAGLFHDSETTSQVRDETVDFIEMWDVIERDFKQLSPAEKDRVEFEVGYSGKDPKFPGFDGNHEGEYMGAARFLTEQLDRYVDIGQRGGSNSHARMVPAYRRMFKVFVGVRPTLTAGPMQADQIIQVLKASEHPAPAA